MIEYAQRTSPDAAFCDATTSRGRRIWTVRLIAVVATLVVAACAISLYRENAEQQLIQRIRDVGGDVSIHHQDQLIFPTSQLRLPLSRFLTEKRISVYAGTRDPDTVLKYASALPRIDNLWIIESNVSSEGLKHLKRYASVGVLSVQKTSLDDSDLQYIAEMPVLQCFMFARTNNTSAALKKLGEAMPKTQMLDANPMTDQQERSLRDSAK